MFHVVHFKMLDFECCHLRTPNHPQTYIRAARLAARKRSSTLILDVVGSNGGALTVSYWLMGALVGEALQNPAVLCELYDVRVSRSDTHSSVSPVWCGIHSSPKLWKHLLHDYHLAWFMIHKFKVGFPHHLDPEIQHSQITFLDIKQWLWNAHGFSSGSDVWCDVLVSFASRNLHFGITVGGIVRQSAVDGCCTRIVTKSNGGTVWAGRDAKR